jgi:tetratricopeptide (TPR) repeat protein
LIQVGDRQTAATTVNQLGLIALKRKDYLLAFDHYQKALEIFVERGDRYGIAGCHLWLGTTFEEQRDYDQARHEYQRAINIYEELGARASAAAIRGHLDTMAIRARLDMIGE